MLERFFSGPAPFIWTTLACFGALAFAYILEHFFAMRPCVLCLYGRYVLMALGSLSLILYFVPHFHKIGLMVLFIGFVGNASLVFYHVLVEHQIVEGPKTCRVTNKAKTVEEFLAQAKTLTVVPCDRPQGTLFGLSITTLSFLFALIMSVYMGACVWIRQRGASHDLLYSSR